MSDVLPAHVKHLIETCIDSVEQLSVLLLLHAEPARVWTTAEITAELRSSESSIQKRLEDLYTRNILVRLAEPEAAHRYRTPLEEISTAIDELANQYRQRPYRVIEAIYTRPHRALQAFANAFKVRGDKA